MGYIPICWCQALRFDLREGGFTIVFFYKDTLGVTQAFPLENMNLILKSGTTESIEMLNRILDVGVKELEDRAYVACMGPPIPPYEIECYCGHKIKMGRDEQGYFIEGASSILFYSKKNGNEGNESE